MRSAHVVAPVWRSLVPFAFPLVLAPALACALTACLQNVSTGTGTTDSTSTSGSTTATATSTTVATGTGCGTDPTTGVELCLGISTCPSITVDGDTLPSCGFRPTGSGLMDLECECNGNALCPIGVPTTCDQATSLLSTATALTICEEVADDRCTALATVSSGSSSGSSASGSTTSTSTCDKTCEGECSGAPDCIQLCGC